MFLFVYFCRDFLKSDLLPKLTEIDYRVKKQKVICCEVV